MQMSDPVQKTLLAVGSGLALILSIIALVVALNAGGGKHDGGRMFGGPQQGQIGGGPQQGQMGGGPGQRGQGGPGGGPGQRQGMIPPGGVEVTPNGTGTTTTK